MSVVDCLMVHFVSVSLSTVQQQWKKQFQSTLKLFKRFLLILRLIFVLFSCFSEISRKLDRSGKPARGKM